MTKRLLITICLLSICLTACSKTNNKESKSSSTKKPSTPKLITTLYAVGDIDSFDKNLKAVAENEIKKNPSSTWLLLGDSGYGNSDQVKSNYQEIIKTIPTNNIHMIYGDHDYGTQDPGGFTDTNKLNTGAESILNAKDNFALGLSSNGKFSSIEIGKSYVWSLIGTNDICVEIPDDVSANCNSSLLSTFITNIANTKNSSTCTIAAWHHPIFAVLKGGGADQANSSKYGIPLFESSIQNGVDIVLNGDHHEFLASNKINNKGKLASKSENYLRQFIVGTGGAPVSADNNTPKLASNAIDSEIKNEIGILKINLYSRMAKLSFITKSKVSYTTNIYC